MSSISSQTSSSHFVPAEVRMGAGADIERTKGVKSVIFTFGRFQPPTIGHGILVTDVCKAARDTKSDHYVFVSASCNDLGKYVKSKVYKSMKVAEDFTSCRANENPLDVYKKVFYMERMFPEANIVNTQEYGVPLHKTLYSFTCLIFRILKHFGNFLSYKCSSVSWFPYVSLSLHCPRDRDTTKMVGTIHETRLS